jgi:hypothetical protein
MNRITRSSLWPLLSQPSLSEREKFLQEYAQALDFYQEIASALQGVINMLDAKAVRRLLAQAAAAKEAVQQCRSRCLLCCATAGASPLYTAPAERNPSQTGVLHHG